MANVPRHEFVEREHQERAYDDVELPLQNGQTSAQPSMVAFITDRLRLAATDIVLQVGTGSGYQTAILARLAGRVCVVESAPQMAVAAQMRLHNLGIDNVELKIGDGHRGWAERAPFDAICVSGSVLEVPRALIQQLAVGGRMVIAVGDTLTLVTHVSVNERRSEALCRVAFPPLSAIAPDSKPPSKNSQKA